LDEADAALDLHSAGIENARQLVKNADAQLSRAQKQIEKAKNEAADQIVAAAKGGPASPSGLVRQARNSQRTPKTTVAAAKQALAKVRADLPDHEAAVADADTLVEMEINKLLVPAAWKLIERAAALRAAASARGQ
jgi:hypothetical protein